MTHREMYNKIKNFDETIRKRKIKRNLHLFLGISLVFFIISFYCFKEPISDSIIIAFVSSGLYCFSGIIIWFPFIHANDKENTHLEELKKEYQEKFNQTWY